MSIKGNSCQTIPKEKAQIKNHKLPVVVFENLGACTGCLPNAGIRRVNQADIRAVVAAHLDRCPNRDNTNDNGVDHRKQEEDTRQSIRHDKMIKEDLEKLTLIIQDKNINDWRYEILDMASAISSGRKYSKEQYEHVIDIYGRYEDLLKSLGRTNGQVDVSMEVIMESYKEKLKNGF